MKESPSILIIRLSSLGDILHVLPAFTALRRKFPDSRIEWLAAKKSEFLVRAIQGVDAIHVVDTDALVRAPLNRVAWRHLADSIRQLRSRRFDLAIDFQGLLKTAFLGLLSGPAMRVGFSKDLVREKPAHWFYQRALQKPPRPVHVVVQNELLAGLIGAVPVSASAELSVSDEDSRIVDELLKGAGVHDFVIINPGGGWPTKCWDPLKYGDLARRIRRELGLPAIITTGPGEEALYEGLAQSCGDPPPPNFQVSFLQLIPLLKKARIFIGGDTGPLHLACTVGTPAVGIFGPTSPSRNGPWRDGDIVVHHKLACSGCYGRSCTTGNECMKIGVDEVFGAVVRRLGIREEAFFERP